MELKKLFRRLESVSHITLFIIAYLHNAYSVYCLPQLCIGWLSYNLQSEHQGYGPDLAASAACSIHIPSFCAGWPCHCQALLATFLAKRQACLLLLTFTGVYQVHIELQQHSQTLKLFQDTNPIEWEGLIVVNRQKLSNEFFNHVENLIHAAHQDQQQREGNA